MNRALFALAMSFVALAAAGLCESASAQQTALRWNAEIADREDSWYATETARAVADAVIAHQSREGGWPKNTDLARPPTGSASGPERGNTFDNGATTLPMRFLARIIDAGGGAVYQTAFHRGFDYMLAAQYSNGGWPQFYPLRGGYHDHITYNDGAMVDILGVLRDAAAGESPYAFVDLARRQKAAAAVARGIDIILRTQVRQNGELTAWCAQHDQETLEPAWARAFEPPSLSGGETVGIVRFLMSMEHPSPEVVRAVEGAVAWLQSAAIRGVRVENFTNADGQPDRRAVSDPRAGPIWARFYELGTNRPIFLGRDSVVRYSFAEIERERRVGYAYYGAWGLALINDEYPAWKARRRS
jgi:PelA/Pel-15E family pectate lyase